MSKDDAAVNWPKRSFTSGGVTQPGKTTAIINEDNILKLRMPSLLLFMIHKAKQ
ncbi:MAG: hypothetical protein KBT89_05215 [Gammaproteobacteria bacterium]|nr:hypothetical protein [Gammaproteobacteria bacterium]